MSKHYLQMVAICVVAAAVSACSANGGGQSSLPNTASAISAAAAAPTAQSGTLHALSVAVSAGSANPYTSLPGLAINAGGSASGTWIADRDYNNGWLSTATHAINTSRSWRPAPQSIYQTQRVSSALTYVVPNLTPNGAYDVRLHFAETWFTSAGKRIFNVDINNTRVLTNLDMYQTAGGANIAIVKDFESRADATGKISVLFGATVNNAAIAGVEIVAAGGSGSPTPIPVVSATPVQVNGCSANNGQGGNGAFPITTCLFTGFQTLHETVAQLVSKGAKLQNQQMVVYLMSENGGAPTKISSAFNQDQEPNTYISVNTDKQYRVHCTLYSCSSIEGRYAHINSDAIIQNNSDAHLYVEDIANGGGFQMWECGGGNGYASWTAGGTSLNCFTGGFYPFNQNAIAAGYHSYQEGLHGGIAFGIMQVTAGDLLQGRIDHALGFGVGCLGHAGDHNWYPTDSAETTDEACPSSENNPPQYGMLLHLKAGYPTAGLSTYCKAILTAENTYGAYPTDTGGGISFNMESSNLYPYGQYKYGAHGNPWQDTIYPAMAAAGEASGGSGSGNTFGFHSNFCWAHLAASNFEAYKLVPGS